MKAFLFKGGFNFSYISKIIIQFLVACILIFLVIVLFNKIDCIKLQTISNNTL